MLLKGGNIIYEKIHLAADGSIDIKDVTILKQYLAKWKVSINAENADVNGDGEINIKDLTLIKQFIAKWKVTLG